MALLPRPKKKMEMFVCDECGTRKRLASGTRHWCDECKRGSPVEMRRTRDKRVAIKRDASPSASDRS